MECGWKPYSVMRSRLLRHIILVLVLPFTLLPRFARADIADSPWTIPSPAELREACLDAAEHLDQGFFPQALPPHSLYEYDYWQRAANTLLSYAYYAEEIAVAREWKEAASFCQLTINVALDSLRDNDKIQEWLETPCEECTTLEAHYHVQLKNHYLVDFDDNAASEQKDMQRYRQRFLETLAKPKPTLLLPLRECQHGLDIKTLKKSDTQKNYFLLDLNQPRQFMRFMRNARNSECRAHAYKAYVNRGARSNQTNLYRMLYFRQQFAESANSTTWARFTLSQTSLEYIQIKQLLYLMSRALPKQSRTAPWDRWTGANTPNVPLAGEKNGKQPLSQIASYFSQLEKTSSLIFEPVSLDSSPTLFSRFRVYWRSQFIGELWLDLLRRQGKDNVRTHSRTVRIGVSENDYPIAAITGSLTNRSLPLRKQQTLARSLGSALEVLLTRNQLLGLSGKPLEADLQGLLGDIFSTILVGPAPMPDHNDLLQASMALSYHNGFATFEQMNDFNRRNAELLGNSFYSPDLFPQFSAKLLAEQQPFAYAEIWRWLIAQKVSQSLLENEGQRSSGRLEPVLTAFAELDLARGKSLLGRLGIETNSLAWVAELLKEHQTQTTSNFAVRVEHHGH